MALTEGQRRHVLGVYASGFPNPLTELEVQPAQATTARCDLRVTRRAEVLPATPQAAKCEIRVTNRIEARAAQPEAALCDLTVARVAHAMAAQPQAARVLLNVDGSEFLEVTPATPQAGLCELLCERRLEALAAQPQGATNDFRATRRVVIKVAQEQLARCEVNPITRPFIVGIKDRWAVPGSLKVWKIPN